MAIDRIILKEPPRLCQLQLYKGTESMFACWAVAAEMIVKWKGPATFFTRPSFEPLLENDKRVEYLAFILEWLDGWGFEFERKGGFSDWTPQQLAETLREAGPLFATGNYGGSGGSPSLGGSAHAIAVYAVDQGQVRYIDPWDATPKRMDAKLFASKLWKSWSAVQSRKPNAIPWQTMSTADPRYFAPDGAR